MKKIILPKKYIEVTPIHAKYLSDRHHRFTVNAAGRRSLKTQLGIRKGIITALSDHDTSGLFGAPTHGQAVRVFWDTLEKELHSFIKDKNKSDRVIILKNNSKIQVSGLDVASRIEGVSFNWAHITEFPDVKQEFWLAHLRPLFSDKYFNGRVWFDGTPDFRFPWYRRFCEDFAGGVIPKAKPFYGAFSENMMSNTAFYTWLSSDVLNVQDVIEAKKMYDQLMFRQEYLGEFIDMGGQVYYAYSSDNHSNIVFNPNLDTYLCFDFNVNPMTCIINQKIRTENGRSIYCFVKEIVLQNSNTQATIDTAINFLKECNFNGRLYITGDYAGNQRSTGNVAGRSDWNIIDDTVTSYYGEKNNRWEMIVKPTRSIRNRTNAMNALFKNTMNEISQYVNIDLCPKLHRDLTDQAYNEKTGGLDDQGGKIGHRSDAASYFAMNFEPIRAKWVRDLEQKYKY